jgi:hypothetical protein
MNKTSMEITTMTSDLAHQTASPHQEDTFGLPLDRNVMFSNHKGVYKKRIEKRQIKVLKKIRAIKNFLKEDEQIFLVTTGCSPTSLFEQILTGWIFIYLKRSLFLFTNQRIFHIPTKANYSYRNSIAQILYSDCKSIQIKGRRLLVEYKNGEKEKFLYISGKEKKKIKALLPTISLEGSPSKSLKRIHLCPRCTSELDEGKYMCANCNLEFKDKDEARKISIIFPGGGYFYTRHPFLGIGDAIVETILLIWVVVSLITVLSGQGNIVTFFIFAIFLAIEKVITIYHSNHFVREYIPKEKEIRPIV